jgi:hypothetical protein
MLTTLDLPSQANAEPEEKGNPQKKKFLFW